MCIEKRHFDSTTTISYAIVVCTKDRPSEIRSFLQNLTIQHSEFLGTVVIVDGSSNGYFQSQIEFQNGTLLTHPHLSFLRTNGGKPTALNLSLRYLRDSNIALDAVVFLDDDISFRLEDVELGVRYLMNNDLCGLSPVIVNDGDTCFRIQSRNRVSGFPFRKSGVLTKSGDNRWFNYRNIKAKWLNSEWLPGGAVIYDWTKIKNLSFSEELENKNLMGYALGDDVDFSMKARVQGDLGCLQEIQVIHSSPVTSYRNPEKLAMARAKWKAFLVNQYPLKFSRNRVVLVEIFRAIWHGVFKGKLKIAFSSLYIFLREFISESKSQKLIAG